MNTDKNIFFIYPRSSVAKNILFFEVLNDGYG